MHKSIERGINMATKFVKKTILLNQDFINKAIRLFNVKTEKEAVNRALEIVIEESDIIDVHKEIGGTAEIEDVFK